VKVVGHRRLELGRVVLVLVGAGDGQRVAVAVPVHLGGDAKARVAPRFGERDQKRVALAKVGKHAQDGGEEGVGADAGGDGGPVGGELSGAKVGVQGAGDAVFCFVFVFLCVFRRRSSFAFFGGGLGFLFWFCMFMCFGGRFEGEI
jgi:hypothetical protein